MREFVARWKDMFIRMGAMPVSFLGGGVVPCMACHVLSL